VRPSKSKKGGELTRVKSGPKMPRKRSICKDKFQIKDLTIESIPVNHSLPGATAYIIHSSIGPIVYTGDLRFHGYGGHLTENFVKRAADLEPAIMITEGTRIRKKTDKDQDKDVECGPRSEEELKEKISELIRESGKKLVVANWPVRDTDRMLSFYRASRENNRKLVISMKQAYLLDLLRAADVDVPSVNDDHIRIYIPRKGWGIFKDERYPDYIQAAGLLHVGERISSPQKCNNRQGNQGKPGRIRLKVRLFRVKEPHRCKTTGRKSIPAFRHGTVRR
jgi:Predicted hydrolase of the metallo-beta-lactamase superfamily